MIKGTKFGTQKYEFKEEHTIQFMNSATQVPSFLRCAFPGRRHVSLLPHRGTDVKLIPLTTCSLGEEIEEDLDCVREFQVFGYYGETGRRGEGVDGNILIV